MDEPERGRPEQEIVFAEQATTPSARKGFAWNGWEFPVYHARGDTHEVAIDLTVPKKSSGLLRVYVIDPDDFDGGRKNKRSLSAISDRSRLPTSETANGWNV